MGQNRNGKRANKSIQRRLRQLPSLHPIPLARPADLGRWAAKIMTISRYRGLLTLGTMIFPLSGCLFLSRETLRERRNDDIVLESRVIGQYRYIKSANLPTEYTGNYIVSKKDDVIINVFDRKNSETASTINTAELERTSAIIISGSYHHYKWTGNPIRYIALPISFAGDCVLDVITLGYPMYWLMKYQSSNEWMSTFIIIDQRNDKQIITTAQQVDSAEASTIAVPPSMPSGSPR